MVGYERGVLKMAGRSQARTGRGSPLCAIRDCTRDITTSTKEHFAKPVLVNTVCQILLDTSLD